MDNLIDHERNAARNTSINPEVKINIGEVRNFEDPKNLLDNVVGAGDGNRNTVLLQKTLTHDFIKHETDNSDSKGAKRKRDESPESYTDLLDDDEAADGKYILKVMLIVLDGKHTIQYLFYKSHLIQQYFMQSSHAHTMLVSC